MSAVFVVQVAADCVTEKVNLKFVYSHAPSLSELLGDARDTFSNVYHRLGILGIFDIRAAVVFNDRRCTWDRLERASQIHSGGQVYLFQPNLPDNPAEIPDALDASSFFSCEDARPELQRLETPRAKVSSRQPWVAPRMKIRYGDGVSVTSKPTPDPQRHKKEYKMFVPGGQRRFSLPQSDEDGVSRFENGAPMTPERGGFSASRSRRRGDSYSPIRFAVRDQDRYWQQAAGTSPVPKKPTSDTAPVVEDIPPLHHWEGNERPVGRSTEGRSRVPPPTPPDDGVLVSVPVTSPRRSISRPSLVSPQRDDDDDDHDDDKGTDRGGAPSVTRPPPTRGTSATDGRPRSRSYATADRPWSAASGGNYSPSARHQQSTSPLPAGSSTSPRSGRISVLSIARDSGHGPAGTFASVRPGVRSHSSSLREERERVSARMQMPLDELRRSLQLEEANLERSLSTRRARS